MHKVWHLTASDGEAPGLELEEWRVIASLPLLPGPLRPRMILPVTVPFMSQSNRSA